MASSTSGGSITTSCTSAQPATSRGQPTWASDSSSGPSGSGVLLDRGQRLRRHPVRVQAELRGELGLANEQVSGPGEGEQLRPLVPPGPATCRSISTRVSCSSSDTAPHLTGRQAQRPQRPRREPQRPPVSSSGVPNRPSVGSSPPWPCGRPVPVPSLVAARQDHHRRCRRAAGARSPCIGHASTECLRGLALVRRGRFTEVFTHRAADPGRCCSPSSASLMAALSSPAIYLAYRFRPAVPADVAGAAEPRALPRSRSSRAAGWCCSPSPSCSACSPASPRRAAGRPGCCCATAPPFGVEDPQFGIDISLFVFDYPFHRFVLGFAVHRDRAARCSPSLAHALPVRRPAAADRRAEGHPGRARAPLGAARASSCCSRRSPTGWTATGWCSPTAATVHRARRYTDVNALLPAKTILVFVAVVCALAVLRQHLRPQLPAAGRRAGAAVCLSS